MSTDWIVQNNPNLRPRDEIRIERLEAIPFPDQRRVRVAIELTPFREPPNLEIAIRDGDGRTVASASAIAVMNFRLTFNLHLRGTADIAGAFAVRVQLYYDDGPPQHVHEVTLHIAPPGLPDGAEDV